jgi:ABC-type dipeptide/oligopeptide/nickel transport system ATPase subunit
LLDFSVAGFQEMNPWDEDASLKEKANHYGTIETDSGLELIWGIGEYGKNEYDVSYTLSNLVRELEDGQALLWNFDTFSDIPAENLTVKITGFEPFTKENVRLWGFGFEGDLQLEGETVVWKAKEKVDSSNDVTVLLQFPKGQFNPLANVDMTLEEQLEIATEGSAYNDVASSDTIFNFVASLLVAVGLGGTAFGIIYYNKIKKAKKEAGQMRSGAQRMKDNKGMALKEIPYQGDDFAGIAYLLQDIHKGYFEDYFSAYLLEWSAQERIIVHTTENKSLFGNTFDTEIEILHFEEERARYPQSFTDFIARLKTESDKTYETGMWLMLLEASNSRGFIEDTQMREWAKKHAKEVEKLADYLIDYSKDYLEKEGLLSFIEINVWGKKHEVAIASPEGDKLMDRLVQFDYYLEKTTLEDFTSNNKPFTFRELLFWNIMYFRSEEITEEFKGIIPTGSNDSGNDHFIYYPLYWNGMTGFRKDWSNGLESGGFNSSASFATSGTGGSTSAGGGAGAGGGGGGGAR